MRRFTPLIIALLALIVTSCSIPNSVEQFLRSSQVDQDGDYVYELDMNDTTCNWSLAIFSKIDGDFGEEFGDVILDAQFASPTGKLYADTLYVSASQFYQAGAYSKEFMVDYRNNFKPVENGPWTLRLHIKQAPEGICGLGIKLSRHCPSAISK